MEMKVDDKWGKKELCSSDKEKEIENIDPVCKKATGLLNTASMPGDKDFNIKYDRILICDEVDIRAVVVMKYKKSYRKYILP